MGLRTQEMGWWGTRSFVPGQRLAVKRLLPSPDGDKVRALGVPTLRPCRHNGQRKSPALLSAAPVAAAGPQRRPWCSGVSVGGGSILRASCR